MSELAEIRGTIGKLQSINIDSGSEKEVEKAVRSLERQMHRMTKEVIGLIDTIQRMLKLGKYSDLARALL